MLCITPSLLRPIVAGLEYSRKVTRGFIFQKASRDYWGPQISPLDYKTIDLSLTADVVTRSQTMGPFIGSKNLSSML